MRLLTWPNAISLLRLPLAVAFAAADSTTVRGAIVAAAGLSDFFDGRIARRFGQHTRSGELLDPITDKAFVFVVLLSFAWEGQLALWELLVLLARDLYTVAAFVSARTLGLHLRFRSRWSGKVTTGVQVLAVLVLLVRPAWSVGVALVAGAVGVWAIVDYTRAGLRSLHGRGGAP